MALDVSFLNFTGVEVAYEKLDGSVTKFEELEFDSEDESGLARRDLFLGEQISALKIRFVAQEEILGPQGIEAVEYFDARFFAYANEADGPLPVHLDSVDEEPDMSPSGLLAQGYELEEMMFLTLNQDLNIRGPWNPSSEVRRLGSRVNVLSERGPTRARGRIMPGAKQLGDYLKSKFPSIHTVHGYANRTMNVSGGSSASRCTPTGARSI